MSGVLVGTVDEFADGIRVIVSTGDTEIGVLRQGERFHAFRNLCPHQGGPVCEGIVVGRVESRLGADRREIGRDFSETELHLVCPWHGWEYDLDTGRCAADPRLRLQRYAVEVVDGRVYVEV